MAGIGEANKGITVLFIISRFHKYIFYCHISLKLYTLMPPLFVGFFFYILTFLLHPYFSLILHLSSRFMNCVSISKPFIFFNACISFEMQMHLNFEMVYSGEIKVIIYSVFSAPPPPNLDYKQTLAIAAKSIVKLHSF